jgi:hypothetical protein
VLWAVWARRCDEETQNHALYGLNLQRRIFQAIFETVDGPFLFLLFETGT